MGKRYKIGYVQGTFDLFHIGHLNLLRNAKDKCDYLIVGVVTNELNKVYKGMMPYIPYIDRAQIVEAISYVDKVIKIDVGSDDKIGIWEKYHYDCHFSGDDHAGENDQLTRELRKRGSDMYFFPYTQKTSSTKIKKDLRKRIVYNLAAKYPCENLPSKIAIYGAGRLGQNLRSKIADADGKKITAWVDQQYEKYRKKGLLVNSPKFLKDVDYNILLIAVLNKKTADKIKEMLINWDIAQEKIIWVDIDLYK